MAGVAIANGLTGSILLPGFGVQQLCLKKCPQKPTALKARAQSMGNKQNINQPNMYKRVKVSDDRRVTSLVCTVTGQEAVSSPLVSEVGVAMGTSMADRIRAIEAEIARMKLEFALEDEMGVEQEVIGEQEKAMEMFLETQKSDAEKYSTASPSKHPYAHLNVSERWREIQGTRNWEGLLDPIDPVLRGEMLRYGEFAQATYDAFDSDAHSRFRGSCKYSKKRLLSKLGLENRGYEITDYLYGTCGDNPMANFFHKLDLDQFAGGRKGEKKPKESIWDKESSWMGFVAVATDPDEIARLGRRDIVVVWRGTVTMLEWLESLTDYLAPSGLDQRNASGNPLNDLKVEAGFLAIYRSRNESSPYTKKSARQQVLEAVKRLVQKYSHEEHLSITVAGHSLGSALAKLSAYDIAESRLNHRSKVHCHKHTIPQQWGEDHELSDAEDQSGSDSEDDHEELLGDIPVTVYSYGGPRVGNDAFRDRVEELGVRVLRVVNENDGVTKLPGVLINEKWQFLEENLKPFWNWLETLPWTYTHIGVEFKLNNLDSPFLRKTKDPWNSHNLEAYLHLLNGFHGSNLPFSPALPRDLALVNKGTDLLTSNHCIPPAWWQDENKGLVRTEEGCWVARSRDPEDLPEYHIDDDIEVCEFL